MEKTHSISGWKWWFLFTRAYALPASVIPFFITVTVALKKPYSIRWINLPFLLGAVLCFHAGSNLANDYWDYQSGIDKADNSPSSWAIVRGLASPSATILAAFLFYLSGFILGILPVIGVSVILVIPAILGAAGGYFYTAPPAQFKYRGLGEVVIFLLFGPLLFAAVFAGLTGKFSVDSLFFSIPPALLVTLIVYGNNLRDAERDAASGVRNIPVLLGFEKAVPGFPLLVILAWIFIGFLYVSGRLSEWAALTLLPLLAYMKTANRVLSKDRKKITDVDVRCSELYIYFGISYMAAVLLS